MFYSSEDLRKIILNAHKIKEFNRCSQCSCTGIENWDENGLDVKAGQGVPDRETGICQRCNGIGFVDITMYDEQGQAEYEMEPTPKKTDKKSRKKNISLRENN